jgi:hypothetical protein
MQHLEALVVHLLVSEPLDVLPNEIEISLVRLDWIAEIILINLLLVISEERTNSFDARSALQILGRKQFVQMFFE